MVRNLEACINTRPDPLTHYVLVRDDLPKGMMAAQVVHAAGESSPGALPEGTFAVVLAASQEKLLELSEVLKAAGIGYKIIRENDPPYSGQIMSLGIQPERRSKLKKYLRYFPLLQ